MSLLVAVHRGHDVTRIDKLGINLYVSAEIRVRKIELRTWYFGRPGKLSKRYTIPTGSSFLLPVPIMVGK